MPPTLTALLPNVSISRPALMNQGIQPLLFLLHFQITDRHMRSGTMEPTMKRSCRKLQIERVMIESGNHEEV